MSSDLNKDLVLNCKEDSFFNLIDKHSKLKIPVYLRKILVLCGYDSALVFSEFDDACICDIEQFIRHEFNSDLIERNEKVEDYLGICKNSQTNFKIVSGHKVLLKSASKHCQMLSQLCLAKHSETNENNNNTNETNQSNSESQPETNKLFDNLMKWMTARESLVEVNLKKKLMKKII